MGVKKDWIIDPAGVGQHYGYHYDTESGPVTLTWSGYRVHVTTRLRKDRDRILRLDLTPDQADLMANQLQEYAAKARRENERVNGNRRDPLADRSAL